MDPLSALGVAASVVQFLQFGGSLVSKSRQIYTQGTLLDDVKCKKASKRLNELTGRIRVSLKEELEKTGTLSSDARALGIICGNCTKLSSELLLNLNKLRVDENHKRKWKSFRQALKSVWSKDGVDSIARRIADCRDELNTHVMVSIKYGTLQIARHQRLFLRCNNVDPNTSAQKQGRGDGAYHG